MIDETLYEELKEYLTKEFMSLSGKKDEVLCEKLRLEVEQKQEEQQLFGNKDSERIKRLFSPFDDELFQEEDFNSYQTNKKLQKIQLLEDDLSNMSQKMEEIKKYLCFVQLLENEKKKENPTEEESTCSDAVREEEKSDSSEKEMDESDDLKEMLESMILFLQKRYPEEEFLLDFENHGKRTDTGMNRYLIQILTYTISASLEASPVDTVLIEGERSEDKIHLSLQILLDDHFIDQYSYQYDLLLKNEK